MLLPTLSKRKKEVRKNKNAVQSIGGWKTENMNRYSKECPTTLAKLKSLEQ